MKDNVELAGHYHKNKPGGHHRAIRLCVILKWYILVYQKLSSKLPVLSCVLMERYWNWDRWLTSNLACQVSLSRAQVYIFRHTEQSTATLLQFSMRPASAFLRSHSLDLNGQEPPFIWWKCSDQFGNWDSLSNPWTCIQTILVEKPYCLMLIILQVIWRPQLTLKKVIVAPSSTTPYSILVCLARSSAESIGDSILSTVRKAARLAV